MILKKIFLKINSKKEGFQWLAEAPIQSFMLTPPLEKNIGIIDKELKFIEEEDIREIGRSWKRFYCVDKTAVVLFYIILHDKDGQAKLEQNTGDWRIGI